MRIVVDASVAVKWVVPEPGSDAAAALLDEELIAPSLWLLEAANALWRSVRLGEMSADHAFRREAELRRAPVTSIALEPHVEAALKLATELGHPIYNCLYLAVALRYGAEVVTADRRFHSVASRSAYADRVRLLAPREDGSLHEL